MGNLISNKKEYENDPSYVVCDAIKLQSRLIKHCHNSKIIDILEETQVASNYVYDISNNVAETNSFSNYNSSHRPLYFSIGFLRFCPGCKIVLTKQLYDDIVKMEKSKIIVPLSKDDQIKILRWGNSFFKV